MAVTTFIWPTVLSWRTRLHGITWSTRGSAHGGNQILAPVFNICIHSKTRPTPTHLPLIARVIEYRELKITYKEQKLWSLHMHSELIACIFYSTNSLEQCVVVHIFNPRTQKAGIFNSSTWEAEPGQGSTKSSPVWSTKWVPIQPELYSGTPSQNKNKIKTNTRPIPHSLPQKENIHRKSGLIGVPQKEASTETKIEYLWSVEEAMWNARLEEQMKTTELLNRQLNHNEPCLDYRGVHGIWKCTRFLFGKNSVKEEAEGRQCWESEMTGQEALLRRGAQHTVCVLRDITGQVR